MNYGAARERKKDGVGTGVWDFTVHNRRSGTYAVGYCRDAPDTSKLVMGTEWPPHEKDRIERNRHKYHTDGHATAEEACECFTEYVLDCTRKRTEKVPKCRECGAEGARIHVVADAHYMQAGPFCGTCADHRPTLRKHFKVRAFASS